ncbi:hypothetical protein HDU85_001751 [Gaertneriomyces sp. JEL0708]|nr:hypothetical protein HDU85_001751 [Gaertneriomyces sp. JEL0708]
MAYIGARISLISKSGIRYVGVLTNINQVESTVSLENVISYGTEGRKGNPAEEIPPSDDLYPFVVFRGSDIEDLHVMSAAAGGNAGGPKVPNDPAVVQSQGGQNVGAAPGPPKPEVQRPGPPPMSGPPGFMGGYGGPMGPMGQPGFGGPHQGYNPYGLPPPNAPEFPQPQPFAPPNQGPRGGTMPPAYWGPQPGMPGNFEMPQPGHSQPPMLPPVGASTPLPVNGPEPKADTAALSAAFGNMQVKEDATPSDNNTSKDAEVKRATNVVDGQLKSRKHEPAERGPQHPASTGEAKAPMSDNIKEDGSKGERHQEHQLGGGSKPTDVEVQEYDAGERPVPNGRYLGRQQQQQQQQQGEGHHRRGGPGRGGSRRPFVPRQQRHNRIPVPDSDFDFESANAKFNKTELVGEATKAVTPETHEDVADHDEEDPDSGFYQKSSFFDNISCEAKERAEGDGRVNRRSRQYEERRLNMETFGQTGSYRGGYGRGGFRRGGYGSRGGYNHRGSYGGNQYQQNHYAYQRQGGFHGQRRDNRGPHAGQAQQQADS